MDRVTSSLNAWDPGAVEEGKSLVFDNTCHTTDCASSRLKCSLGQIQVASPGLSRHTPSTAMGYPQPAPGSGSSHLNKSPHTPSSGPRVSGEGEICRKLSWWSLGETT